MTRSFAFQDDVVSPDSPRWLVCLERARAEHFRPLCLCRPTGVAMYVARVGGQLSVKRMPNSGVDHALSCESYEPPPEISGMGQVLGQAIREDGDSGQVMLRLESSLTRLSGRVSPMPGDAASGTARADTTRLSLRGLLHYLWHQGGLHRWTPAMAGKRSWAVVRRQVLTASQTMRTKAGPLHDVLYMPEPFVLEDKAQIQARRQAAFGALASASSGGRRRLGLLIGEVKELAPARYGRQAVLKHQPDAAFQVSEALHSRLTRRFETPLGLWSAHPDSHLVLVGTFSVATNGVASIEEAALTAMTAQWIPFESVYERALVDHLIHRGRRFMKSLRFDLAAEAPLACALLTDTEVATALFIEPPGASERYALELEQVLAATALIAWIWRPSIEPMPMLPPPLRRY